MSRPAPSSPRPDRGDLTDWIAEQQPLVDVVSAAIAGAGLGEPRIQVGPSFYPRRFGGDVAHLRRGAVWFLGRPPKNTGFRVEMYGGWTKIVAWSMHRRMTVECHDVAPEVLAKDLWLTLQVCQIVPEEPLVLQDTAPAS